MLPNLILASVLGPSENLYEKFFFFFFTYCNSINFRVGHIKYIQKSTKSQKWLAFWLLFVFFNGSFQSFITNYIYNYDINMFFPTWFFPIFMYIITWKNDHFPVLELQEFQTIFACLWPCRRSLLGEGVDPAVLNFARRGRLSTADATRRTNNQQPKNQTTTQFWSSRFQFKVSISKTWQLFGFGRLYET